MNDSIGAAQTAGLVIKENVALAPLTTLMVGGAARFFAEAETENQVKEAVVWAKSNAVPLFILGGGSNVVISDRGFEGLVLKINSKGFEIEEVEGGVAVTAQAGEDWDGFVRFCVEKNLAGVECLSGIPGTVGGTPVQNVGAYGQEVSETIAKVRVLNRNTGAAGDLINEECGFSYRKSIFNTARRNEFIVLSVTFYLKPGGAPKVVYKDLRERFGKAQPSLGEVRSAVLDIRRSKSMVIDKGDPNSKSAGSFFKNPIVTKKELSQISSRSGLEIIPTFKIDDDNVKIPAAWLIEKSGFPKGFRFGRTGISTNHTLAIVNVDNASAQDIIALEIEIREKVKETFGVELHPEPIFVGFDENEKRG